MTGKNSSGFVSELKQSFGEYISLIKQLNSENSTDDEDKEDDIIIKASNEEVVDNAHKKIKEQYSSLSYENPRSVVMEGELILANMRDEIVNKIDEITKKERESKSGAEIDTMLYVVDRDAGRSEFTIIGGAKSLIYNMSEQQDWTPEERDLFLQANKIAGNKNNLERHQILDVVAIIPNDENYYDN